METSTLPPVQMGPPPPRPRTAQPGPDAGPLTGPFIDPRTETSSDTRRPPTLEDAALRAVAEVRRHRRQTPTGLPGLSPVQLAKSDVLAGVAELRQAIIPPGTHALDRRL